MGTYEELSNSGIDFAALLKASEEEEEEVPTAPLAHGLPTALEAGSHMSLISIGSDFEVTKDKRKSFLSDALKKLNEWVPWCVMIFSWVNEIPGFIDVMKVVHAKKNFIVFLECFLGYVVRKISSLKIHIN